MNAALLSLLRVLAGAAAGAFARRMLRDIADKEDGTRADRQESLDSGSGNGSS